MPDIATLRFDDIKIGDAAEFHVEITVALVDRFAELSGDVSPIHVDEKFAETSAFGRRIAHGAIGGMLFSRLIGTLLPGKYALYLSQQLTFRAPVFLGTTVSVKGVVSQKVEAAKAIRLSLSMSDKATGKLLTEGEALVQLQQ